MMQTKHTKMLTKFLKKLDYCQKDDDINSKITKQEVAKYIMGALNQK